MTRKILIADDNHDLADGLMMVVEDEGYEVTVAYSGSDALKQLLKMDFDMAFIDIKMPGINGIEVMSQYLKVSDRTCIVLMTGYRIEQVFMESCGSGEVSVFRSPVAAEAFFSLLDEPAVALIINGAETLPTEVSDYFTAKGKRVYLASKPATVLDEIDKATPDILLLDFKQPVTVTMSVFVELKKKITSLPRIIIFKSGEYDGSDSLRSYSLTGCLFKPFKPEDVLRIIQGMEN